MRGACFWRSGCFILWLALFCKLDAAPKVLGVGGGPAMGLKEAGEVLIGELQCANCHEGAGSNPLSRRHGPDLTEVGQRVSSAYLLEFLTDPLGAHEGTKMPDLLGSMSNRDREDAASALTAFLRVWAKRKVFPGGRKRETPRRERFFSRKWGASLAMPLHPRVRLVKADGLGFACPHSGKIQSIVLGGISA